jgi:hypothetical protein
MASITTNQPYGLFSAAEFVAHPWPEREVLLAPWLLSSSINVLYAKAGIGKSNLVLGMALAMARGEAFLGFSPPHPLRVVYVDGEMPTQELHRRLTAMANGQPLPHSLYIISTAAAEDRFKLPSLNTAEGQEHLMRMVDDVATDVLILDNKSTLMSNARENEAGSWDDYQRWLMNLRASGLVVILLHHAGKNGQQRGTSALEVTPEIILELYEPEGPPPAQGSHFVLEFEKKRHLHGEQAAPKLISLHMHDHSAEWGWQPYKGGRKADPRKVEALALYQQGLSLNKIAEQLKASTSTIHTWVKAAA